MMLQYKQAAIDDLTLESVSNGRMQRTTCLLPTPGECDEMNHQTLPPRLYNMCFGDYYTNQSFLVCPEQLLSRVCELMMRFSYSAHRLLPSSVPLPELHSCKTSGGHVYTCTCMCTEITQVYITCSVPAERNILQ